MKKYNEYLNSESVKNYCDEVFELCTPDKNNDYNDITEDGLKIK
jgi:hypothetical protein